LRRKTILNRIRWRRSAPQLRSRDLPLCSEFLDAITGGFYLESAFDRAQKRGRVLHATRFVSLWADNQNVYGYGCGATRICRLRWLNFGSTSHAANAENCSHAEATRVSNALKKTSLNTVLVYGRRDDGIAVLFHGSPYRVRGHFTPCVEIAGIILAFDYWGFGLRTKRLSRTRLWLDPTRT